MAKIVWAASAIKDLDDIGNYIAQDSEKYARLTVQKLFNGVDVLEKHPNFGRIVPELADPQIRELINNNYRVVYMVVDKRKIEILTVHKANRLLSNSFEPPDL